MLLGSFLRTILQSIAPILAGVPSGSLYLAHAPSNSIPTALIWVCLGILCRLIFGFIVGLHCDYH